MKQFKCKECDYQFDKPLMISVSYRDYYGSKLWHDQNETCPDCHSMRIEQQFCCIDELDQDDENSGDLE